MRPQRDDGGEMLWLLQLQVRLQQRLGHRTDGDIVDQHVHRVRRGMGRVDHGGEAEADGRLARYRRDGDNGFAFD